jgi:hypothetical protein
MGRLFIHDKDGNLIGIIDEDLGLEWLDEDVFGDQSRPNSKNKHRKRLKNKKEKRDDLSGSNTEVN